MIDLKAILSLGISVKLSAREVNGLCKELTDNQDRIAELEDMLGNIIKHIDEDTTEDAAYHYPEMKRLLAKGGAE